MNKSIVITGANGYVGQHVVKAALDMGHKVTAVDFSFENVDSRADRITLDIFSGESDIFKKLGEPDVCIHLAWRNGFQHNADTHITDLPGHYIFLKNLVDAGLKSLAVMGSMHEIGYWEGAIDENTPANPSSLYGISKNALRQMMKMYCTAGKTQLKWLRGYYIMGDDKMNHSIFTKLSEMEAKNEEWFPFTTGKNKYDFIHINELAKQIVCASVQDEISGEINCCSGEPVSLADKVESYIKEHNFKIKLKYGAFPDRPYDSPAVWGDASRIQKIMNEK